MADRLRMTVAQLRAEMPNDEFVRWGIWHQRRVQREELAAKKARRR